MPQILLPDAVVMLDACIVQMMVHIVHNILLYEPEEELRLRG